MPAQRKSGNSAQYVPTVEEIQAMRASREGVQMNRASTREAKADLRAEVLRLNCLVKQLEEQLRVAQGKPGTKKFDPARARELMEQVLHNRGLDPIDELVRLVTPDEDGNVSCPLRERIQVLMKLSDYRVPALKSVEHSGSVDHSLTVHIVRFDPGKSPAPGQLIDITPVPKLQEGTTAAAGGGGDG